MSIRHITSRDNPHYKTLRHLANNGQTRRKTEQALLDGIHLCETWLERMGMPLLCAVAESALANQEVARIVQSCEKEGAPVISLPESLFSPLRQVQNGIDLLFVVAIPAPALPATLRQSAVLLDRVQDPGNLGSILRSAAAAGLRQIFCSKGTVQAYSPKVLRAGMGAHCVLEIFEQVDLSVLIAHCALPVIATSSYASQTLYELELFTPVAWLLGNEGQGVDAGLLAAATHRVNIPHQGKVESLNVAASAAVCFFEQVRQMRVAKGV